MTRLELDLAELTLAWSIDLIEPTFFSSWRPEKLPSRLSLRLSDCFTLMKGRK